jgi:hypothetical protein
VKISGEMRHLWRVVDHGDDALDKPPPSPSSSSAR